MDFMTLFMIVYAVTIVSQCINIQKITISVNNGMALENGIGQ